jgi:1-acyl-sn-glycerol-3-phosphate acyltransferase
MISRTDRIQITPIPLTSPRYLSLVGFFQLAGYWPCRILSTLLTHKKVRILLDPADIDPNCHYILAANHQSLIDPFIICSELPLTLWPSLGRFRYFAHAGLFENRLMRWALLAFGGFPTRPFRRLPYGLEAARAYIGRGQTVVIFPEGRRSLPGDATARDGVYQLGTSQNVRVIPVHLRWYKSKKRSYRLTVGKPLPAGQSAQAVMEAIYTLPLP